jgi:hypothetical protein
LAEDLTGWGTDTALMVKIYFDCFAQTSLAGQGGSVDGKPYCDVVGSSGDSLPRRGGMLLFLMYLFEQTGSAIYSNSSPGDVSGGGVNFLRALNENSTIGTTNLERATNRTFFAWYSDYAVTLAVDNTDHKLGSQFNFQNEVLDPFSGLPRLIRTRTSRADLDGSTIVLDGPEDVTDTTVKSDVSLDGKIYSSGAGALKLTIPAALSSTIKISGDPDLDLGLAIVPIQ